jgi:peptidoglycan/LPS O-acetylase OafA/YrhL
MLMQELLKIFVFQFFEERTYHFIPVSRLLMKGVTMNNSRYEELDSLRGLAAFAVMLSHFMLIIPASKITQLIEFGPTRLLVAGSEAVMLFFVLSGFVLSLPYHHNNNNNNIGFGTFWLKRFLRIYLPYYIAILVAIISSQCVYTGRVDLLSDWFNGPWSNDMSLSLILSHVILIGSFSNEQLDPVIWSLVYEMRISLIFPFLMILLRRFNLKMSITLAFLCSIISFLVYLLLSKPNNDFIQTMHYFSMFIIGALLAKYRKNLTSKVKGLSKRIKILWFVFGLFMYLYAKPAFALKLILGDRDPFLATIVDSWCVTLGACIIILFSLSLNTFSKFLLRKPIHFLGKISYSLYLYHCIVLFTITHLLFSKISIWVIWTLALIGSLLISSLSYFLIEKASINLGKKLTRIKVTDLGIKAENSA